MSKRVYIQEVATRDGFQIESRFIPTADKIALIDQLSATGLAKIEVTSFTSPKAIPNLRDAEEVMRGIRRVPGVVYTVLVPNEKGCERALACGVDEINLVMSASDTHGLANLRVTPSVTNFLLIHFPDQDGKRAAEADEFLCSRGYILRQVRGYGFPNALRMTIGPEEANRGVVDALREFLNR